MKRFILWTLLLVSIFSLLSVASSIAELKVLVFDSKRFGFFNDFVTVSEFTKVAGETIEYTLTEDLAGETTLEDYDIVWVGHAEICEDVYFFDRDTEKKIKSYVEAGGVFVTCDQDNDGCETTWLPLPLEIVEAADHLFEPTDEAGDLFEKPNEINIDAPRMDDNYANFDKQYIVLATAPGNAADFLLLEYGRGAYFLVAVATESAQEAEAASPLFENILHFIISRDYGFAVEPSGKLAVIWGQLRNGLNIDN